MQTIAPLFSGRLNSQPRVQSQKQAARVTTAADQFVTRSAKPRLQFGSHWLVNYFAGTTDVMEWAKDGDYKNLKKALSDDDHQHNTIDYKDIFGQTALIKAIDSNQKRCAKLLVKWGANVDEIKAQGKLQGEEDKAFRKELMDISKKSWEERMALEI